MATISFQRSALVELHDRMHDLLSRGKAGRTVREIRVHVGNALAHDGDPVPMNEPPHGWAFLWGFSVLHSPDAAVTIRDALRGAAK